MRKFNNNWRTTLAVAIASSFLVACGGGGSNGGGVATPIPAPTIPAPTVDEARIAAEGLDWINSRRAQLGVAPLAKNTQISAAAQAHSYYQKANNLVTHDEEAGKPGFTGLGLKERLPAANYVFNTTNNYAYGEIISATTSTSGQFMAEELVTAIYHRFVMFEPMFKEIGTGAATTSAGYSYFTADMTANNNYGTGVGRGNVVIWPYNGQTGVTPNFFSDNEAPDPVPDTNPNDNIDDNINEVGYPISVHGDITATLAVQSFRVHERGASADLTVKLLTNASDNPPKPPSAAAIIPLTPLKAGTTYDVTFVGVADGIPVTKTWAFTTK